MTPAPSLVEALTRLGGVRADLSKRDVLQPVPAKTDAVDDRRGGAVLVAGSLPGGERVVDPEATSMDRAHRAAVPARSSTTSP